RRPRVAAAHRASHAGPCRRMRRSHTRATQTRCRSAGRGCARRYASGTLRAVAFGDARDEAPREPRLVVVAEILLAAGPEQQQGIVLALETGIRTDPAGGNEVEPLALEFCARV